MKKAPRHSVVLTWECVKSAGLIDQLLPPKLNCTFTAVLQASFEVVLSAHKLSNSIDTYDKCNILPIGPSLLVIQGSVRRCLQ
jgi:hypothetical protein